RSAVHVLSHDPHFNLVQSITTVLFFFFNDTESYEIYTLSLHDALPISGVAVAKHGNRAITSQAGSADVLEALGIRIDLPPYEAARSLTERHFAFFFAPQYHPAFKFISQARKLCAERGQRTIFNFLGPPPNPA